MTNHKKRPLQFPLHKTSKERGSLREEMVDQKGRKVAMKSEKLHLPNPHLREARQKRGWSQKELANRIGTDPVNISRWEHGSHFPSPYFRPKLSEVLGKTPSELGLVPSPPPSAESNPPPSQPPPLSKIWNIPFTRNPYFTGREDLLALLHERLTTTKAAALTQAQALYGLGGIGKTQTAIEYAFRYADEYAHLLWILADSRETLVADLVALAKLLNLPEKDVQDQHQIIAAVKRWLAETENWLLILDNADDLPMVKEFLPTFHKGYLLFTTRSQALGSIAAPVEVEKLDLQDGILLLLHWTKRLDKDAPLDQAQTSDREIAEHIVQEMDGLPLALVQAAAYIDETGCTLEDYLQLYAMHRKDLLARRSRFLTEYPETVATTWSISFEKVEQQSPVAADLLRLCAFLAPDAIPEELLTRGAVELGAIPGTEVNDTFKLNDALEVLRRYSLVRREANAHTLSIHRLVQAVLKDSMDQQTQHAWAERTVQAVNAAFPEAESDADDAHQYYLQYYIPHVQECASLIEQYHIYIPEAGRLLYQVGAFLYVHSFYPQSQSLHQQALTIRKQVFGSEHSVIAESLNALALLSRLQGDYEHAERFHRQALAIREKTLGPDHPATAQSLNNLGVLYRNQGEYERAESLLQQALGIREQVLGSEDPETLNSFINLAKLYVAQGRYEQAKPLAKRVLVISEHALESRHHLAAQSLSLLAKLSYEQRNYEHAEALLKRALNLAEQIFGLEHPSTAEQLNNLAEFYFTQGRYTEAESLCQMSLSICKNILGPEHPDTITYREHLNRIVSKRKKEREDGHHPPAPLAP